MYCTSSDITPSFPEGVAKLVNPKGEGQLSTEFVNAQITMISAFMDSTLATQYLIPITGAQSLLVLKGIAIPLVREAIYGFSSQKELPKYIVASANTAREELNRYTDVADGRTKPSKTLPDAPNRFTIRFDDEGLNTLNNDAFL